MDRPENYYRPLTDEFYKLYRSFIESGFTEEQAISLTSSYCHNHVVDNIMQELNRKTISKSEMRRRFEQSKNSIKKEEETKNDQT